MADIPHYVLSDRFHDLVQNRKVIAAVFLTFRFEPAFFEQEVLPVLFDVPLSHATPVRLVQLEDALRSVPEGIAVYYDCNGLEPASGGAKLDVRRIAIRHRTGIFHSKNVFILLEDRNPDSTGDKGRALLVSCLSANLTRAGWWENVEVCHTEEIRQGESTRLRDDLSSFLSDLERRAFDKGGDNHAALKAIRSFLKRTDQLVQRTANGKMHTHFYDGRTSLIEFFRDAAGNSLQGMSLEIISPYFDSTAESTPLRDLLNYFKPRETRVFLPRKNSGEALCSPELFAWIDGLSGVTWARLPKDMLRGARTDDTRSRFVHAKVYRFHSMRPRREVLFVGSVNLTSAAHQTGGNLETGFLVEVSPPNEDWWLEAELTQPRDFDQPQTGGDIAANGGTRLSLRFSWDSDTAAAYWDDTSASPRLVITSQGVELFKLDPLKPRAWMKLPPVACSEMKRILISTSILGIIEGDSGETAWLLVQEEGMSHRPSLLFDLSPSEILRFWSLLSAEQRAAFLDVHAPEIALQGEGAALVARYLSLVNHDTFFQRFAGIFHAFGCVERSIRKSLEENHPREATHLLFGRKYDSLGRLLERVQQDVAKGQGDLIDHYLMLLCTRQLIKEISRDYAEYWCGNRDSGDRLRDQLDVLATVRESIAATDVENMPGFLDWFEKWFLRRAISIDAEEIA